MSNFHPFALAMAAHFAQLSQSELYRVAIPGDDLWNAYLAAFPPGTNPIYRVRTEHDGSYDRAFIRKVGNVVRINADGSLTSIWDIPVALESPYVEVCTELALLVKRADVDTLFRINEQKIGVVRNVENKAGVTTEFFHFHADIAAKHYTREVDTKVGNANTTMLVMRRGFTEISPDAVDTVLGLIDEGLLYRGTEFQANLLDFHRAQQRFLTANDQQRATLAWQYLDSPAARLRNTVIGTLLTDLSEGQDLERAVKSYEQKVAPTNYKRPTALITPAMITAATTTIRELGLESALERRFATVSDLSVNNVLWVDNEVQGEMKDGLTDLLMQEVKAKPIKDGGKTNEITIADFMAGVLPKALGIELFFANPLQANLVSLTAPVHADAGSLFKWNNNFGWSYNGNITDSIKEKVKAAGGNTNAALRVSLAWYNHDDLDIHAECPDGHVFYGSKSGSNRTGRNILDVDMNAGGGTTRTPVENLSWITPKDGTYKIVINQFRRRETSDVGFTLEVENEGKVTQFSYPLAVTDNVVALQFTVKSARITDLKVVDKHISGQGITQHKWGLATEGFVKVDTVLASPNHWDGEATGNKHWFFMLAGCKNDEPTRGIYNEFLKPSLETHRKVFEVLGNKTKCLPTSEQLSGLGFSSTKRDSVIVKVTEANSTKLYTVHF